jgi:hypothetical protein
LKYLLLKNARKNAWESDSRNGFWTFLGCPKLKSALRLLQKLVL